MIAAARIFQGSWLARIVSSFAGMFAALLAIIFVGVWFISAHILRDSAHEELNADLASFSDVYAQRLLPGLREAVERRTGEARLAFLLGRAGEALAGDIARAPSGAMEVRGEPRRLGTWLIASKPLLGGFRLLVAHDRARDDALLTRLAAALAGLFAVAALFAVAGGLLVGKATLARVDVLNATLREVEGGDLSARAAVGARNDEFDALGRGVNATLTRLSALVAGLKAIGQRIAHEMRTPLAHLRADLDDARRGAEGEQARRLETLVADVDEMIAVFGALLDVTLTEASTGDPRGLAPVAMDEVIAQSVELYEAVAEDKDVRLIHAPQAQASVTGDRHLLLRMVANLIDNAIKFSPPGGAVEVGLEREGARALISVRDHGPGLPDAFRATAFELFSRAPGAAATPGHGLGLALVRAVATRHGMSVTLEDARPGLRVVIAAPIRSA